VRYFEITSAGRDRLTKALASRNLPDYVVGETTLLFELQDRIVSDEHYYLYFPRDVADRAVASAIKRGYVRILTDREVVLYRLQGKI